LRQSYTAHITSLASPTPPLSSLPSPTSPLSPLSLTEPAAPLFPPHFLPRLRMLSTQAHARCGPRAALFLTRLFSAARHCAELDASLLCARAADDTLALARAHRVLGGADGGAALVAAAAAWDGASVSESQSSVDGGSARDGAGALEAGIRDARQVRVLLTAGDGTSTFSGARSSAKGKAASEARTSDERERRPEQEQEQEQEQEREPAWLSGDVDAAELGWDLSEADVGKIAPRVLSHRLRVREGPADEVLASLVFPACGTTPLVDGEDGAGDGEVWSRRTVKDILVQLFKEI
jgi:hypothetical protein